MKNLFSLLLMSLPFVCIAQVIPDTLSEYFVLAGKRYDVNIVDIDDEKITFIKPGLTKTRTVLLKDVSEHQLAEIWSIPFQKNDLGNVEYSEVVKVQGKSKTQLYMAAKKWFAISFKDSKEVIQLDNEDAGVLTGKGAMDYGSTDGTMFFDLNLEFKEGRYRYVFNNFNILHYVSGVKYEFSLEESPCVTKAKLSNGLKKQKAIILKEMDDTLKSLKMALSKTTSDW